MSIHKAIIASIRVTPHPDPTVHSLAVGQVCHETVICGKGIPDGTLGIYFPCELQLSEEFAVANDLLRRKDADGKAAGGMFEANRRVRVQKFKGIKSVGFWTSLEALAKLGGNISSLKEGDQIDTWNGKLVCNKYVTPQTQRRLSNQAKKERKDNPLFIKHSDTSQFKYSLSQIKPGDKLVITSKLHGTSQRVTRTYDDRPLKWWEKFLIKLGVNVNTREIKNLNGTRNVVLKGDNTGYYTESWRERVAEKLYPYLGVHQQIFFEVVGWEDGGASIMPSHTIPTTEKALLKDYGNSITYSYGCETGKWDIYVYRIAYVLPDNKVIDLPWDDVKQWCNERSIKHVPEIQKMVFDGDYDSLADHVENLSDGPEGLDSSHIREGVCIRVDGTEWKCFKNKGYSFKLLEGIIKSSDTYEDQEEVS